MVLQIVFDCLLRILIGVTATLIFHAGGVKMLSLAGRQHDENGRLKYSVTKDRYHVAGLCLALCAGSIIALRLPEALFLVQCIAWLTLMLTGEFFIYKAIKAVEGDGWMRIESNRPD